MAPTTKPDPAAADSGDAAPAEYSPARGDLVELHDGCYAAVVTVDPVSVVRFGYPQPYELPVTKVA